MSPHTSAAWRSFNKRVEETLKARLELERGVEGVFLDVSLERALMHVDAVPAGISACSVETVIKN